MTDITKGEGEVRVRTNAVLSDYFGPLSESAIGRIANSFVQIYKDAVRGHHVPKAEVAVTGTSTQAGEWTLYAKNGLQVKVLLEETVFGPKVLLEGVNCRLEGHIPGEYYLMSD